MTRTAPRILVLVLLAAVFVVGCGGVWPNGDPIFPGGSATTQPIVPLTPLGRVDVARQSWVAAQDFIDPLIRGKVIRDPATLRSIRTAMDEIERDLDEAEHLARTGGDPFNFEFVLTRAVNAIAAVRSTAAEKKAGKIPPAPTTRKVTP